MNTTIQTEAQINEAKPEAAEMISAPATCRKCRIQMDSPTTGLLLSKCPMCGDKLEPTKSDAPQPDLARLMKAWSETVKEKVRADEAEEENSRLKSRVEELEKLVSRLLDYANHTPTCRLPAAPCDCGLDQILEENSAKYPPTQPKDSQ